MQYLSAYTLAALSGKQPTKDQVNAILKATGSPVDGAQVDAVMESLKGKDLSQLISKGFSKVGASSGSAPASKPAEKKKDDKPAKVEKAPEPVKNDDQEDEDFNIDLFG